MRRKCPRLESKKAMPQLREFLGYEVKKTAIRQGPFVGECISAVGFSQLELLGPCFSAAPRRLMPGLNVVGREFRQIRCRAAGGRLPVAHTSAAPTVVVGRTGINILQRKTNIEIPLRDNDYVDKKKNER